MTRRRILVAVDFSTQSDFALDYARHIAARLDAMISCIYVIEEQELLADKITGIELKHKLRREAENKLSERVHLILNKEEKVPFELIITSGNAHHKILEKSVDLKALLIVIGRSDSNKTQSARIGSNAKKIVSSSLVPVVVVHKKSFGKRKHLIFPVDLETPYSDKLNRAIEIALVLGALVSVLAVIKKERSSLRPVYNSKLKEIGRSFSEKKIVCHTHLLENQTTISSEILAFSNSIEHGIILLMTHQEKKSDRPYLGLIEADVLVRTELPLIFLNPASTVSLSMYDPRQENHPTFSPGVPMKDHII